MVCQEYKAVIVDEDDIEECLMYTHEAERRYYDIKVTVADPRGCKGCLNTGQIFKVLFLATGSVRVFFYC